MKPRPTVDMKRVDRFTRDLPARPGPQVVCPSPSTLAARALIAEVLVAEEERLLDAGRQVQIQDLGHPGAGHAQLPGALGVSS